MSKYEPLKNHFKGLSLDSWSTSFSEIEKIIGAKLPPSARKYNEWWSNDDSHVVGESWVSQGWVRDTLNLERGYVTFSKKKVYPYTFSKKTPELQHNTNLNLSINFSWISIGTLGLDNKGKIGFPKPEKKPGIYKLEIMYEDVCSIYIGEASNIFNRLKNYRNPGAGQITSSRINKILHERLDQKAFIKVFVCYEAWVFTPKKKKIYFENKYERVLFENSAIFFEKANKVVLLNK